MNEPTEKCPYCNSEMYAEWIDTGVGLKQSAPFYCTGCRAHEISHGEIREDLTEEELRTGFYKGEDWDVEVRDFDSEIARIAELNKKFIQLHEKNKRKERLDE